MADEQLEEARTGLLENLPPDAAAVITSNLDGREQAMSIVASGKAGAPQHVRQDLLTMAQRIDAAESEDQMIAAVMANPVSLFKFEQCGRMFSSLGATEIARINAAISKLKTAAKREWTSADDVKGIGQMMRPYLPATTPAQMQNARWMIVHCFFNTMPTQLDLSECLSWSALRRATPR